MKKIIHTDLHYGGAYPKNDPHAKMPTEYGTDVMYLGDVFDFSGCRKSKMDELQEDYVKFLGNCQHTNTIAIRGNHEARYGLNLPWGFREDDVLYIHGHRALWEQKKWTHWETKKGGKSWWKYAAIVIKNTFAATVGHGVNKETLETLADFAIDRACSTIVVGHKHPENLVDKMVNGVRVVVCPRGRSEINV